MVVFNEAYFRTPIIGYFSFVCAEKHTKSFAVDIFFYLAQREKAKECFLQFIFHKQKKQRRL